MYRDCYVYIFSRRVNEGDFKFVHVTPQLLYVPGCMPVKMSAPISETSREISGIARERTRAQRVLGNLMRVHWPICRSATIGFSTKIQWDCDTKILSGSKSIRRISIMCQYAETRPSCLTIDSRSQVVQARRPSYKRARVPSISELPGRRDSFNENGYIVTALRDIVCDIALFERSCNTRSSVAVVSRVDEKLF